MLEIEFEAPHIHLSFSENSEVFGGIGNSGNQINIYDTHTFTRIHALSLPGAPVTSFYIKNRKVHASTSDGRIKVFELTTSEGVMVRDL